MLELLSLCADCGYLAVKYDDVTCKKFCGNCGLNQGHVDIGTVEFQSVKLTGLQKVTVGKKRKHKSFKNRVSKLQKVEPWKLEELFEYIFMKQIESMQPFVTNYDYFKRMAVSLWAKYLEFTGTNFDLTNAKTVDVKIKDYPLGWGNYYIPKDGARPSAKAKMEILKTVKETSAENDCCVAAPSKSKVKKNIKIVQVERTIRNKRIDTKIKSNRIMESESLVDEVPNKLEMKFENAEFVDDSESTESEGTLSGEDEGGGYQRLDNLDWRELKQARTILHKKNKMMWGGSQIMECNVALLVIVLTQSRCGTEYCSCLVDLLRLIRQQKIPYIRITRYIPEQFYYMDFGIPQMLLRDSVPSYDTVRSLWIKIMRGIKMNFYLRVDVGVLTKRFISDLQLPTDLWLVINQLRHLCYKTLERSGQKGSLSVLVKDKTYHFINSTIFIEPLCLAYIFVALRLLYKLNGDFEFQIDTFIKAIDDGKNDYFNLCEWIIDRNVGLSLDMVSCLNDLRYVKSAKSFLSMEGEDDETSAENSNNLEDRLQLQRNEVVNQYGRTCHLQRNSKKFKNETINTFIEPLKACLDIAKMDYPDKTEFRNFKNKSITFLTKPDFSQLTVEKPDLRHLIEETQRLITEKVFRWKHIYDGQQKTQTAESLEPLREEEKLLLSILLTNTGIKYALVCDLIRRIESNHFTV